MIDSFEDFYCRTASKLSQSLDDHLSPPARDDALLKELLTRRFFDCLSLTKTPDKTPLFRLVFGCDFSDGALRTSFCSDPDGAARSCEFYAGFFPEYIDSLLSRKKSSVGLDHFEKTLGLAYGSLGYTFPVFVLASSQPGAVLCAFRNVSSSFSWEQDDKGLFLRPYDVN